MGDTIFAFNLSGQRHTKCYRFIIYFFVWYFYCASLDICILFRDIFHIQIQTFSSSCLLFLPPSLISPQNPTRVIFWAPRAEHHCPGLMLLHCMKIETQTQQATPATPASPWQATAFTTDQDGVVGEFILSPTLTKTWMEYRKQQLSKHRTSGNEAQRSLKEKNRMSPLIAPVACTASVQTHVLGLADRAWQTP